MDVAWISTLAQFEAERADWERLERGDRYATVFTSWRWLRAYLPVTRLRWKILALREAGEAVAYLPIAAGGSLFDRELYLGGNPYADYTGMIADPAYEEAASAQFAAALAKERWDGFNARDVNDPRVEAILGALARSGFTLRETSVSRCLSVGLPATWEEYIATKISAKTRVNTLRVERRLAEAFPSFRITEANDADVEAHVEAMIAVNHKRWGGNLRTARRRFGTLFRNAYERGLLRVFGYWDGATPIAGAAVFVDDLRSTFGVYMIGFDEAYAKFSPGKGIVGRVIRTAIESGYARLDFLRGEEPFKQNYAGEVTLTRHVRLAPPGLRAAAIEFARPKLLALKSSVGGAIFRSRRTS